MDCSVSPGVANTFNMKHPKYDLIMAYAEGKQIQYRYDNNWIDYARGSQPNFEGALDLRVKPEVKTYKYRLGLYDAPMCPILFTATATSSIDWERHPKFIKWVTEWTTVSVEE